MEPQELKAQLEQLEKNLKTATTAEAKAEIEKQITELKKLIPDTKGLENSINEVKGVVDGVSRTVDEIKQWQVTKDEADRKNQEALDQLLAQSKKTHQQSERKNFGAAFAEAVQENWKEISQVSKGHKFVMDLKTVGNMTVTGNLTGDPVHSYSDRQAILPAQKVNFRDLMRTVYSETGSYVHFRESGSEGSIGKQTEGESKPQIDYDLTEVKTASEYIAGYARFSKQMLKNLPFFQTTLPVLLLRDFFKNENAQFWSDVVNNGSIATAAGVATDDIEKLIDAIGNQLNDNFNASFVLVGQLQMARLNKLLYSSGNQYTGQGGVVSSANGSISIAGVPIIPASWVTDDKGLIIDQDYLERIEVEGLRIGFYEQDSDNVQKNLITARIECMEAVNLMLPSSARYFDFGNVS